MEAVNSMVFQKTEIDMAPVPADAAQKAHWQATFDKERVAFARKAELEDGAKRLEDLRQKTQAELTRSEDALSKRILSWAVTGKSYKSVTESRQKISELRDQLRDIEDGFRLIGTAVAKETNVPISHGATARGQIQYLLDKKRQAEAKKENS